MCLDCGCHRPLDPHGDHRHITLPDLTEAAQASGITVEEAAANITDTLHNSISPDVAFAQIINRPTVVCDVDGVLNFIAESICTALNARFGTTYHPDEVTSYQVADMVPPEQGAWMAGQFKDPAFYAASPADFHAVDTLKAAKAAGYAVLVATERDPALASATQEWLDLWNVPHDSLSVLGPTGKRDVLARFGPDNPAVLIDDDPAKESFIPRAGVELWVPQRPWTPDGIAPPGVWRFQSWTDVRARLGLK